MASSSIASDSPKAMLSKSSLARVRMEEMESQGYVNPGSWMLPEEVTMIPDPPPGFIVSTEAYAISGLC